jgi:pyruvate dehydrogenase E2 component (dihydrolipoamide acetyltransferase)
MANIIEMPKLSDTMTVGALVKWLKKEGDPVRTGDVLAEVETDKATMELESFFDGELLAIFVSEGSQVAIGEPLCAIGKPGEKVSPPPAKAPPAAAQAAPPAPPAAAPRPAPSPERAPAAVPRVSAAPPSRGVAERVKISPLARKLASERGVDPARVAGSGPGGRIVRADIAAAAASGSATANQPPGAGVAPAASRGPLQDDKLVPVSITRGTIARRLLESKTQIPHYYLDIEIDAGPLLEMREQLNAALEKDGVKLSVNDFILKASAEALRRVPAVNCSWEGNAIRFHSAAHLSFAVAIDDGLITPVIRDAHMKTIFAISSEAKALAKKAKDRELALEEFTGGTFCVTNLGMMGIDRFCAIINPPNAAILAVGASVRKPVVKDNGIAIGQRMTLTLSGDHRVVDGAVGAAYLSALKDLLEKPALLLI